MCLEISAPSAVADFPLPRSQLRLCPACLRVLFGRTAAEFEFFFFVSFSSVFFTFSGPPRVSLRTKHSRDDLIDERDLGTERERNNLPRCILFFFFFFVSDGHTWHDCDELYTGPIEAEPRWVME